MPSEWREFNTWVELQSAKIQSLGFMVLRELFSLRQSKEKQNES